MSELKQLVEEMEAPLGGEAKAFVDEIKSGKRKLVRSTVEVPEDVLTRSEISFSFETEQGNVLLPYSAKLNGALLRMGVAMDGPAAEAVRLGKLLLDNLRLPDAKFGKQYTDPVLWEYIDGRFGHVPQIREILDDLPHTIPMDAPTLEECRYLLKTFIDGAGNSLVVELGYEDKAAWTILVAAVFYLLDIRYQVSLRRMLAIE